MLVSCLKERTINAECLDEVDFLGNKITLRTKEEKEDETSE